MHDNIVAPASLHSGFMLQKRLGRLRKLSYNEMPLHFILAKIQNVDENVSKWSHKYIAAGNIKQFGSFLQN